MASYAFETITAAEAQSIKAGDTLTLAGPARSVAVSYTPLGLPLPAQIILTAGGRTVAFGTELSELSLRGGVRVADGSKLFIGDFGSNGTIGSDLGGGLYGGGGGDTLLGRAGDDFIHGNSGDDSLQGGEGHDTVYGGQGADTIVIGLEGDRNSGGFGHGNLGEDTLIGGAGADTLLGGQDADRLSGGEGDDYLSGDLGDDEIRAGGGADEIYGGSGNDSLFSGGGSDFIRGGDGSDFIVSEGQGFVWIDGGAGDDTIVVAGIGMDRIRGGEGRDRFEVIAGERPGVDQIHAIHDWQADESLHFNQVGIYTLGAERYAETTADDMQQAIARARDLMGQGKAHVAVQVNGDVYVFAETNGDPADGPDAAVSLVGVGLDAVDWTNFY